MTTPTRNKDDKSTKLVYLNTVQVQYVKRNCFFTTKNKKGVVYR